MKRRELVRHLERHGCELLREGANHSIYVSRTASKASAVPRHSEINDDLARKICKDLSVLPPYDRTLVLNAGKARTAHRPLAIPSKGPPAKWENGHYVPP